MGARDGGEERGYWVSRLLSWYGEAARDLPWRRAKDPYAIWISEIMLQQTRVAAVEGFYHRFLSEFPTLGDLARADIERVLKAWEGLGYYSRARNLHRAAGIVEERHGGSLPADYEALLELPGVGPYTAGALGSIAFDLPHPAPDGNAFRVFARLFGYAEDTGAARGKRILTVLMRDHLPVNSPGRYNQAIMELGALICIPGKPRCGLCPLMTDCRAFADGTQDRIPLAVPRRKPREKSRCAFVVEHGDELLMIRRPEGVLLAGFWEFPGGECGEGETPGAVLQRLELELADVQSLGQYRCTFSGEHWRVRVFRGSWTRGPLAADIDGCWFAPPEFADITLARAFRPIARMIGR